MKKVLPWVFIASLTALLIDWIIVGLKFMEGKYDVTPLIYGAVALWVVMFGCIIFFSFPIANALIVGK